MKFLNRFYPYYTFIVRNFLTSFIIPIPSFPNFSLRLFVFFQIFFYPPNFSFSQCPLRPISLFQNVPFPNITSPNFLFFPISPFPNFLSTYIFFPLCPSFQFPFFNPLIPIFVLLRGRSFMTILWPFWAPPPVSKCQIFVDPLPPVSMFQIFTTPASPKREMKFSR